MQAEQRMAYRIVLLERRAVDAIDETAMTTDLEEAGALRKALAKDFGQGYSDALIETAEQQL